MTEYRIRKREPLCAVSGEPFAPGDVVVSAIFEEGESFVRRDMHERHFGDPDAAFCYWKTTQPEPPPEQHRLDFDQAADFLTKLLREADPSREGLVYTLALLLARKRRVKIKATHRLPDGELLEVLIPGDEEDTLHSVRAPRLDEGRIDALQAEIAELFDLPGRAAPEPQRPEPQRPESQHPESQHPEPQPSAAPETDAG
jgi:hypothetical protein